MAPYHHILAHFPMGLLFVSFFIIAARVFSDGEWVRGLDRVLPVLLILGVLGAVATFITGLLIWPAEAVVESPMGRNKILFAAWATAAWMVVALVRIRGGERVWQDGLRWPFLVLAVIAAGGLATTGTLGGYLLGSPSDFSLGLRAIGWDVYHTFYSATWALGLAVIAAAAIVAVSFLGGRRSAD